MWIYITGLCLMRIIFSWCLSWITQAHFMISNIINGNCIAKFIFAFIYYHYHFTSVSIKIIFMTYIICSIGFSYKCIFGVMRNLYGFCATS